MPIILRIGKGNFRVYAENTRRKLRMGGAKRPLQRRTGI